MPFMFATPQVSEFTIADAVWDENVAGHGGANTFGLSQTSTQSDTQVLASSRLTAARAAALDELLAANIPTDLAGIIADIAANLAAIQLNELEADAAARDAAMQTDLTNIEADTAGLAGAAMRGTDLTELEYEVDLASGANYVPPADTQFCWMAEQIGATEINMEWYDSINAAWTIYIFAELEIGVYFQTTNQRFRLINDDGANAKALGVFGWTL